MFLFGFLALFGTITNYFTLPEVCLALYVDPDADASPDSRSNLQRDRRDVLSSHSAQKDGKLSNSCRARGDQDSSSRLGSDGSGAMRVLKWSCNVQKCRIAACIPFAMDAALM